MQGCKMKSTHYLIFIFVLFSTTAFCKTDYQIEGFSEKYTGLISIEEGNKDEVFNNGSISIIEASTGKSIITIYAKGLTLDIDTTAKTIPLQLPYDKQRFFIAQDFNFDNITDFAIRDGRNSCYGGPSYQVYLQTERGLKHSEEFTQLAQNYCGMFDVDYKTQTIHTSTKSGCCEHEYSTFKVDKNKPVVMEIVKSDFIINTVLKRNVKKTRIENQMLEREYNTLRDDLDLTLIYSLTFKGGKTMELFHWKADEEYLVYIFKNKSEEIELAYSGEFIFNKNEQTLTFTKHKTMYQIHNDEITVKLPKRTANLKADAINNTALSSVLEIAFSNLEIK